LVESLHLLSLQYPFSF